MAKGAIEKAWEQGLSGLSDIADATPGVGHIKGAVHYLQGDYEAGNKAMLAATRTTVVMGGGALGSLLGPGGSMVGGVAAGAAFDVAVTAIDSYIHEEYRPWGYCAAVQDVIDKPSLGTVAKLLVNVGADAFTGHQGGKLMEYYMEKSVLTQKIDQGERYDIFSKTENLGIK